MAALSIGFVVPYGEPSPGFFPDTLLAELCATAREAGHRAELVHVYYDGHDADRDAEVARRLARWLADREVDLVVLERIFDPEPVRLHLAGASHRRSVLVSRGDSFDPAPGIDWVVGAVPGLTRSGATRRTPTVAELALAFERLVEAVAGGGDPAAIPGVGRIVDGAILEGPPLARAEPRRPYRAVAEHDVIALGDPPKVLRKTLFGNVGCPFAADPLENAHYKNLILPEGGGLARLGCAFCSMGGDYEKRPDADLVASLVEQAAFWTEHAPAVEELVLNDQYALRYLPSLIRKAHAAGVRPVRWLFAARPDSFVRERSRVEQSIAAAEETGHAVEVYLSGFEAFCDAELARYNKGATVADFAAAIDTMRQLAVAHPSAFAYARARGHSLILWSPWTSPEDLGESAGNLRALGARELFHELGKNRLRLYRDLPIYYAAERDGALAEDWDHGDEGAGRRKGYNIEQPWRFLDRRTRVAHALAMALRDRLGFEAEIALLSAASRFAADLVEIPDDVEAIVQPILAGLGALEETLQTLAGPRKSGPSRGLVTRGHVVLFAGACNNHCAACSNRDRWLDDRPEALAARIDAARAGPGPVILAGREPTVHPAFGALLKQARGGDRRPVSIVTNGRRFAYAAFARASARAGLSGASVKLFAPDAERSDAITESPGAHAQALAGLAELAAAGIEDREIRVPLHRENLADLPAYVALAQQHRARQLRVECALDAVGLGSLAAAAGALAALADRCAREGVALEASPLGASTRLFEWYPGRSNGSR